MVVAAIIDVYFGAYIQKFGSYIKYIKNLCNFGRFRLELRWMSFGMFLWCYKLQ